MSAIELTKEQMNQVIRDMDEQIEMLSQEEIEVIASKINTKINIPFVSEKKEKIIIVKIVKKIDRFFYENLPNELYGFVHDASDGISEEEAKELNYILARRLNNKLDIPFLPEWIEQQIFELAVNILVNAMKKQYSILVDKIEETVE